MSSVLSRWASKLATRRSLLASAEKSVAYWARRAGSTHGRQMLEAAKAKRALRRDQVAFAERVTGRHAGVTSISPNGLALIAGFEGFRSAPYQDVVGVWTIGYGETRGVGPHSPPVTREQALATLKRRVNADYLAPVLKVCNDANFPVTQGQADALASLVYNLGPGILADGRTMGLALRSRNVSRVAAAFLVYDMAGGRHLPGLTRRRRAERALFLKG